MEYKLVKKSAPVPHVRSKHVDEVEPPSNPWVMTKDIRFPAVYSMCGRILQLNQLSKVCGPSAFCCEGEP